MYHSVAQENTIYFTDVIFKFQSYSGDMAQQQQQQQQPLFAYYLGFWKQVKKSHRTGLIHQGFCQHFLLNDPIGLGCRGVQGGYRC